MLNRESTRIDANWGRDIGNWILFIGGRYFFKRGARAARPCLQKDRGHPARYNACGDNSAPRAASPYRRKKQDFENQEAREEATSSISSTSMFDVQCWMFDVRLPPQTTLKTFLAVALLITFFPCIF